MDIEPRDICAGGGGASNGSRRETGPELGPIETGGIDDGTGPDGEFAAADGLLAIPEFAAAYGADGAEGSAANGAPTGPERGRDGVPAGENGEAGELGPAPNPAGIIGGWLDGVANGDCDGAGVTYGCDG